MRAIVVLSVLVLAMTSVWAEGGTNESPALDGTSLVSVVTADAAVANEDFAITVELDAAAASNGTEVGWTTQVCINSGVCYPPETSVLFPDSDSRLWTGSIAVDEEASYVNWRIELYWPEGNDSSVPETGFGWKVWSTCWYDADSGEWGGSDAPCQEEEGGLPGFGATLGAASLAMAAFMSRRD